MSARVASVEFDEPTHTYRLDGRIAPSVTQVLDGVLGDGWNHDEIAAQFGTNVHKAIALDLRGKLDWASVDVALIPYLEAADKFMRDMELVVIASEQIVCHRGPRYCGTLDLAGYVRKDKRVSVFDFKSGGLTAYVGAQLSAYAVGFGVPQADRYAVLLQGDGRYQIKQQTDPADWPLFQSCLNVYNFKQRSKAA